MRDLRSVLGSFKERLHELFSLERVFFFRGVMEYEDEKKDRRGSCRDAVAAGEGCPGWVFGLQQPFMGLHSSLEGSEMVEIYHIEKKDNMINIKGIYIVAIFWYEKTKTEEKKFFRVDRVSIGKVIYGPGGVTEEISQTWMGKARNFPQRRSAQAPQKVRPVLKLADAIFGA